MTTVEELTGIVKGLADVVKSQLSSQHEAQEVNRQHIEALAKTVSDLASNSTNTSSVDTLKLPQVVLPRYTGKPEEQLDRFLDQLTTLLKSSGVPPKHWTTYLKQQVQQDVRAYDSVVFAEDECKHALGEDPNDITPERYVQYFELVKASLLKKRGKPKDERIRELLQDYYQLQQEKTELVSTFAHRFCEIQHELGKCIPGIHYTATNDDIELRHAFLIKLRPDIGKALISRDAKYSTLAEIIEAASRFEQSFPPLPVLSSSYVDPFREDKAMLGSKCCYNCNQPGTQGLTPFFLIFGREPVLPTDVMLSPVVVVPQNQETYAQELITRLSKAHGYMAAITQELRQKQKEYYDLGRKSITFDVGDLVVVRRPQKSGQSGIAAKWLPRWSGPYRIVERMPNDDNYRLEHVETGKLLDPTNVDKLIKVEPWAAEQPNSEESIPNNGEDTSPENPLSRSDEQYENGTFIVYEKLGDILDDDVKLMIEELFDWLKVQNNHKSSTGEACKHLYAKNPQYKKILQSIGGIRQLLIHTPSILFEMPNATGGNNALKLLDASQPLKYHLDRLGGRYGIGRVTHYYEDEDVYELELWDRKSKKTKWNKPLRPVKLEEEFATELVQSKRILCSIELDDKFKIGKTAEKQLEDLQLLLVCYNNSCFPCTSCTF
jgi:hypothetical protein